MVFASQERRAPLARSFISPNAALLVDLLTFETRSGQLEYQKEWKKMLLRLVHVRDVGVGSVKSIWNNNGEGSVS